MQSKIYNLQSYVICNENLIINNFIISYKKIELKIILKNNTKKLRSKLIESQPIFP